MNGYRIVARFILNAEIRTVQANRYTERVKGVSVRRKDVPTRGNRNARSGNMNSLTRLRMFYGSTKIDR